MYFSKQGINMNKHELLQGQGEVQEIQLKEASSCAYV